MTKGMGTKPLFFDRLIAQQKAIAMRGWYYLAGYVLVWSLPYIYFDLTSPEDNGGYLIMSFVGIGLNFALLYTLMSSNEILDSGAKTGIPAYFGLSILHSIGLLVGFVFLVLPGFYLLIRWIAAFARLIDSDEGIVSAMRWSWQRTSEHRLKLALAFVGPLAFYSIAIACLIYQEVFWELYPQEPWETMYTWTTVVANLALSIGMAWYALLGVAAYACLRDANELIAETFE